MSFTIPGTGPILIPAASTLGASPALGDNSLQIATTAFLKQGQGSMAGFQVLTGTAVTLTAAEAGSYIALTGFSAVVTLPNPATLPLGTRFYLENATGITAITINTVGGADMIGPNTNLSSPVTTLQIQSTTAMEFIVQNSTRYRVVGGSGVANLAGNGYQKFSSGIIIQWGNIASSASADVVLTWPIAFPNFARSLSLTAAGGSVVATYNGLGASTVNVAAYTTNTAARVSTPLAWIAIGY